MCVREREVLQASGEPFRQYFPVAYRKFIQSKIYYILSYANCIERIFKLLLRAFFGIAAAIATVVVVPPTQSEQSDGAILTQKPTIFAKLFPTFCIKMMTVDTIMQYSKCVGTHRGAAWLAYASHTKFL